MKTFALICTALIAAPALAQRPVGGSAAGGIFSPVTAPVTTIQPTVPPPTAAPGTPFSQVEPTAPLTATPRAAGGFVPRGPNGFDATPSALGQTFQRSVLGADFPDARAFDPAASVPTAFLPAANAGEPEVIQNFPVVLVPGTFPGTFEVIPASQFFSGQMAEPGVIPESELASIHPVVPIRPPVVFNFPPGARVVSTPPSAINGPVSVIQQPLSAAGVGTSPGIETDFDAAPSRVLPGAPAEPRVEPTVPVTGTGFRIVRPAQARLD